MPTAFTVDGGRKRQCLCHDHLRGLAVHTNLFAYGNSKFEVYEALNRDGTRDNKVISGAEFWIFPCIIALTTDKMPSYIPFLTLSMVHFGAAFFLWSNMRTVIFNFIDASNRNFTMHMIDWMNNSERDRQGHSD
jgi:hypothetical protein